MTKKLAILAGLGLMILHPALADTLVDFSFSGVLQDNGKSAGTLATATGELYFDQTGPFVTAQLRDVSISGVPGYHDQFGFSPVEYNVWDVAPDGTLLAGFFESSTSKGAAEHGVDFELNYSGFSPGIGTGFFTFYPNDTTSEVFSSYEASFTQVDASAIPEPMSVALLAVGVTGLMLMKRRIPKPA